MTRWHSQRLALRRAAAFVRKDAAQQASYRMALVLELTSTLFVVTMFFFLGRLVDSSGVSMVGSGKGYFGFALTGIAISNYLSISLHGFADQVRQGQVTGTLETLFLTPAAEWEIVAWGSLWRFLYESIRIGFYLLAGMLFGLSLDDANWIGALLVIAFAVLALSPLGILSAAFIVIFKRGDPLSYFLTSLSTLVAGVYYPIEVLPVWMQRCAEFVPLTHAIRGFRAAVLEGASIADLLPSFAALALFALVLGPIALWTFTASVDWGRRSGSLAQF